jgi:hypothetical protein
MMVLHSRCPVIAAAVAETPSARESKRCRDLIEQAEHLAPADIDEPLRISALCRAPAVSERRLRKAFRRIHGRHLRMLRLSRARQEHEPGLSNRPMLTSTAQVILRFSTFSSSNSVTRHGVNLVLSISACELAPAAPRLRSAHLTAMSLVGR